MKNYRDRQIYIGREEIDYVAYKCLENEFQIIPVKDPEEYQENDFIQRAENKEVTIPNWIIDVYGLMESISREKWMITVSSIVKPKSRRTSRSRNNPLLTSRRGTK